MGNELISVSGTEGLLVLAAEMRDDKKIGYGHSASHEVGLLRTHRRASGGIQRQVKGDESELTIGQEVYLRNMRQDYEAIKKLNSTFDEGYRAEIVGLMDKALALGEEKRDRGLSNRRAIIRARKGQVERGEYFWIEHVRPASSLLGALSKKGVDVGELKDIIDVELIGLNYRTRLGF